MSNVPKFSALVAVCFVLGFPSHAQSPGDPAPGAAVVPAAAGVGESVAADSPASPRDLSNPASVSQVRIVRLSEIRGTVHLDRHTGRGFEPAYANIPIVRGSKLRTGAGLAEVEFEDNSTIRLAPDTVVEFAELGRSANGVTLTACKVLSGMVYVNLGTRPGAFTVSAGSSLLTPAPKSRLRLDLANATTTVAVLDGSVDVAGAFGSTTVPRKRTMSFADGGQPTLLAADRIASSPFDEWNKQGNDYQSRYSNAAFGGAGMGFGSSDLNYYGSFANMPGCGSMWRPYFANAAWDPYGSGTWAMYPGAGYSFVSPYPWGWLPYHSGAWQQCGGAGWGWNPNGFNGTGGSWFGLNNVAVLSGTPTGGGRIYHAPLKPPVGKTSLVSAGTQPPEVSRLTTNDKFTFQQNSAGLGVPREVFGKLAHTAQAVDRHGSASTEAAVGFLSAPGAGRPGLASPGIAAGLGTGRMIPVITRSSGPGGSGGSGAWGTTRTASVGGSGLTSPSSRGGMPAAMHSSGAASGGTAAGGGGGHK